MVGFPLAVSDWVALASGAGGAALGAAVGGIVTWKTTESLQRQRQAYENQQRRVADARTLIAICRIHADEMSRLRVGVKVAIKARRWKQPPHTAIFLHQLSRDELALLVSHLDEDTWAVISHAQADAALVRGMIENFPGTEIDDKTAEALERCAGRFDAARESLTELKGKAQKEEQDAKRDPS